PELTADLIRGLDRLSSAVDVDVADADAVAALDGPGVEGDDLAGLEGQQVLLAALAPQLGDAGFVDGGELAGTHGATGRPVEQSLAPSALVRVGVLNRWWLRRQVEQAPLFDERVKALGHFRVLRLEHFEVLQERVEMG